MKNLLNISTDLSLPRDFVTSTDIVYGGKGMGKTNLGSVLVEEMTKQGLRWCTLDPMGVWWGLRHSPDGKGPGIECVILGGAHGDIPIEPTGGAVVADLVIDENANTIIDFSRKANGQMWTVGEKIRFVTDYTYRLFQRQGELIAGQRREPMKQILDEAARYIPQVIPSGAIDLAKCVAAWEQVAEEGRNIGLGVTFLTQRSARMNKSVSELADVMFAFRTIGPNSLRAVMDWLGEHVEKTHVKELAEKVRALDVGHALVVSPGWLRVEKIAAIRMRETFDSSATPKAGQRQKRVTGKASKPDLKKYQERMAETIEKVKNDDPKMLRQRILELERTIKNGSTTSVPAKVHTTREVFKIVEKPVLKDVQIKRLQKLFEDLHDEFERHHNRASNMQDRSSGILNPILAAFQEVRSFKASVGVRPGRPEGSTPPELPHHKDAEVDIPSTLPTGDTKISEPQQRILDALAWLESARVTVSPRPQVAALATQSPKSSAYSNNLSSLRTRGLIDYSGNSTLSLTPQGRGLANAPSEPLDGMQVQTRVKELISAPQSRIVSALVSAYPEDLSRDELAQKAIQSPLSSAFSNNLSTLRTSGFIEYSGPNRVRAAGLLFI